MTVNYIKTVKEECDPNSCCGCGTISQLWVKHFKCYSQYGYSVTKHPKT